MDQSKMIIVSGLPGTGKTTFARELSSGLRLPLISKDIFKELLFDALGWSDRDWSKKVGLAAYAILDYLVEEELAAGGSFIVESNFKPEFDNEKFQLLQSRYGFKAVQILFTADPDVLFARFKQRAENGERHPGHVDTENLDEWRDAFRSQQSEPLTLRGDLITVDTTDFAKVDFDEVIARVAPL